MDGHGSHSCEGVAEKKSHHFSKDFLVEDDDSFAAWVEVWCWGHIMFFFQSSEVCLGFLGSKKCCYQVHPAFPQDEEAEFS